MPTRLHTLAVLLCTALTTAAQVSPAPGGDKPSPKSKPAPQVRPAPAAGPKKPALPPSSPLARITVLGASVSGGFGNGLPLAAVLDQALRVAHKRPKNRAITSFFMSPHQLGALQVTRALGDKPTLVIGCDFLFWYLYGAHYGKGARLRSLEKGLAQLDRLGKVPLVIGDIPDVHHADPRMIPKHVMPTVPVIDRGNKRIRQWAAKRKHVLLVPLSSWVEEMKKGVTLRPDPALGEKKPFTLVSRQGMQRDRLHPTRAGTTALARRLIRCIRARHKTIKAAHFHITLDEVARERAPVRAAPPAGKKVKPGRSAGDKKGSGKT